MKLISPTGKFLSDTIREATYIHHQDSPSAIWTVNHPLNKRPSVTVTVLIGGVDEAVLVDYEYVSDSQIVVRFGAAESGKVFLN